MLSGPYTYRALQIFEELRLYSWNSVYVRCATYTRSPKTSNGHYVWLAVILVEWSFLLQSKAHRLMTARDFERLMNKMIALQNHTNGPLECQTATAWLRRLSYQQFPYQQRITPSDIGRQLFIFNEGGPASRLGQSFSTITGISISDFAFLCLGVVVHALIEKDYTMSHLWFRHFKDRLSPDSIDNFLGLLSCSGPFEAPSHESGYYQQSQLFRKPLLRNNSGNGRATYEYIHRNHLCLAVSDLIYDTLRSHDANTFMGQFGDCFSSYLEILIKRSGSEYSTENTLKRSRSTTGSKVVDFAICEHQHTILIEAKAIEASATVKSTASGETLGERLRDSLLKAIVQGRETAKKIKLVPTRPSNICYLIIVTYKQLYLATGRIIKDCISENLISHLTDDLDGNQILPFDNIFVFSSAEFERLSQAVFEGKTTFSQFLLDVQGSESNRVDQKFTISQHLDLADYRRHPDFLTKYFDHLSETSA